MRPFDYMKKIDTNDLPLMILKSLPCIHTEGQKLNGDTNQIIRFHVVLTDYKSNEGILYFTYTHSKFPPIYAVLFEGHLDALISNYNKLISGDKFYSVLYSAFYTHLFKFVNIKPNFKPDHDFSSYIRNHVNGHGISTMLFNWYRFVSNFYETIEDVTIDKDLLLRPTMTRTDFITPIISKLSGLSFADLFAIASYENCQD